jgi:hypothetical protein
MYNVLTIISHLFLAAVLASQGAVVVSVCTIYLYVSAVTGDQKSQRA